jgi:hypothetical protein
VEAYGDRRWLERGCVLPATWLLHEGFEVHREHPRSPLLRVDTKRTVRWAETFEHAWEEVLGRLPRRARVPVPEGVGGGQSSARDDRLRSEPSHPAAARPSGTSDPPGTLPHLSTSRYLRASGSRPDAAPLDTPVDAYRELFAHRDARWPLLTSTFSRITPGMIALAIVLLVREGGYSYAAAGLVTAGHQLGVGFASPVQGRLADRLGQSRVLRPDAVIYLAGTLGLVALVHVRASVPALVAVTVVTGAFYPPVTACSRVVLSRLFPTGQLRETAFAMSSIAVELGFIVGPLIAVGLATTVGAGAAVAFAGIAAFIGALGYAATAVARAAPTRARRAGWRRAAFDRGPGDGGGVRRHRGRVRGHRHRGPGRRRAAGRGSPGGGLPARLHRRRQPRRRGRVRRAGLAGHRRVRGCGSCRW